MPQLSADELQVILQQLDQALYNPDQWFKSVNRTLVCRLTPDERDLSGEAHRLCKFGQWFYQDVPEALRSQDGFKAIEDEHRQMHAVAAQLLHVATTQQGALSVNDYDRFARAVERLRSQIDSVKGELADLVYRRDPLTGTHLRLGLLNTLREQHELVKRQVHVCTLAMMDLDHFKSINDTYGHLVGDRVLAWTGHYLMSHLRPYDKVYRYGGEEFVLCLPNTDPPQAHGIVDRLREGLARESVPSGVGELTLQVTASFGLAALEADGSVEQALDRADLALYAAKSAGRNCVRVWEPGL